MAINPLFVFDDFDPKDGKGPEYHSRQCEHIIFRCREILTNRTRSEIDEIHDLNQYILSEHHSGLDEISKVIEAEEKGISLKYETNSDPLLKCVERYELDDTTINNLKWSEMFAVQSLVYISLACNSEKEFEENKDERDIDIGFRYRTSSEYESLYSVGMWALDAMESLGYAEMFHSLEKHNDNIEEITTNKISLNNRKAAIARHAKSNALKKEFITFYKSGDFPSMSNAADIFLNQLDDLKKKILAPTNAKRTLTQALSQHLKIMHTSTC